MSRVSLDGKVKKKKPIQSCQIASSVAPEPAEARSGDGGAAAPVFALDPPEFTIGGKAWYNTWTLRLAGTTLPEADFSTVVGPAAALRWENVFVSGTYLTGSLGGARGRVGGKSGPTVDIKMQFNETDLAAADRCDLDESQLLDSLHPLPP